MGRRNRQEHSKNAGRGRQSARVVFSSSRGGRGGKSSSGDSRGGRGGRGGSSRGGGRGGRGNRGNQGSSSSPSSSSSSSSASVSVSNTTVVDFVDDEKKHLMDAFANLRSLDDLPLSKTFTEVSDDDDSNDQDHGSGSKTREEKAQAVTNLLREKLLHLGFSDRVIAFSLSKTKDLQSAVDICVQFADNEDFLAADELQRRRNEGLEIVVPGSRASATISVDSLSLDTLVRAGADESAAKDALVQFHAVASTESLYSAAFSLFTSVVLPPSAPLNEDLEEEVEALKAIYDDIFSVLESSEEWYRFRLTLNEQPFEQLLLVPKGPRCLASLLLLSDPSIDNSSVAFPLLADANRTLLARCIDDLAAPTLFDLCSLGQELFQSIEERLETSVAQEQQKLKNEEQARIKRQRERQAEQEKQREVREKEKQQRNSALFIERSRRKVAEREQQDRKNAERQAARDRFLRRRLQMQTGGGDEETEELEEEEEEDEDAAAAADSVASAESEAAVLIEELSTSASAVVARNTISDVSTGFAAKQYMKQWGADVRGAKNAELDRSDLSADAAQINLESEAISRLKERKRQQQEERQQQQQQRSETLQQRTEEACEEPQSEEERMREASAEIDRKREAALIEAREISKQHAADAKREKEQNERLFQLHRKKQQQPAYKKMLSQRKKLPVFNFKDEIVSAVNENDALLVAGETGCGKSTQVAQLLLDDALERKRAGSTFIMVTQPRRLAAISLAERVANERCEPLGRTVGYSIRLESKQSADTKLLFCTTGVLLRRIQSDSELENVSHVILDEVHERSLDSDFLLTLMKDLIVRRRIKLILMSATVNFQLFESYLNHCPVIKIPGRTFPVKPIFLETIVEKLRYVLDRESEFAIKSKSKPSFGKGYDRADEHMEELHRFQFFRDQFSVAEFSDSTIETLSLMNEEVINYELVEQLIWHIAIGEDDEDDDGGAILVFAPGMNEISTIVDGLTVRAEEHRSKLRREKKQAGANRIRDVKIFGLHSMLANLDQRQIFQRPPSGVRKIIVSTNIAETSLTVEDVTCVIDLGFVKQTGFDHDLQIGTLTTTFNSQSSSVQRRGRAGRVAPGRCFHLFTSLNFKTRQKHELAEIHRVSLESLLLQVLYLDLGLLFLDEFLEKPARSMINGSLRRLRKLGALEGDGSNVALTPLGFHLAQLPVEPRIAKAMIYGVLFRCCMPILIISACMSSSGGIFQSPLGRREAADKCRAKFSAEHSSDHLAFLNAFMAWKEVKRRDRSMERQFCRANFLSLTQLKMAEQMTAQYFNLLCELDFIQDDDHSANDDPKLILAVMAAGLYPNVAKIVDDSSGGGGARKFPSVTAQLLDGSKCAIHPSSLVAKKKTGSASKDHEALVSVTASDAGHTWIAFSERFKSSKVYLRGVSPCSFFALLIFGGHLQWNRKKEELVVDGSIRAKSTPITTSLIKEMRRLISSLLVVHIEQPEKNIAEQAEQLTRAIKRLL